LAPERLGLELRPFAAAALLALVVVPIGSPVQWIGYAAAAALIVLAGTLRLILWRLLPPGLTETVPSFVFLIAVALLRSAAGGANAGVSVVALLPVFWTSLYGDRRQLFLVTIGLAVFFLAPPLLVGAPSYPSSQYRAGVLFLAVSAIIGFTTQWLVAQVRLQAREAERARAEQITALSDMASTDSLTGLPNRRAWESALADALASEEHVVVAMLDLDHFKDFNDTRGHPAGDRLLKEAAAAWRGELRAGDFLARLGGEEFALLLPNCSLEDALSVVERLRGRMPYEQTCSAGVAVRIPAESAENVMVRADAALYSAKAAGRDRVWLVP
jgi:diguanylate cyclase (GGDEF)-like protein